MAASRAGARRRTDPARAGRRPTEATGAARQTRTERRAAPLGPGAPPPPGRGRRRRRAAGPRPGLRALVRAGVARPRPAGPQVVVTVHEGESTDADRQLAEPAARDRQLAGLPDLRLLPRRADPCFPGSYALHQNQTFAEVRAILGAGPNIYPVDVRPGFTLSEVAAAGGQPARATPRAASRRPPAAGRCTRSSRRRGPTISRACSGRAPTSILPGRPTSPSCAPWCSASTRTRRPPG